MERDRTNEFKDIISNAQVRNNFKKIPNLYLNPLETRSRFLTLAQKINEGVVLCYIKLDNLANLCKNRSLFEDQTDEINELSYIIKLDVVNLKTELDQLSTTLKNDVNRDLPDDSHHKKSILTTLEKKLAHISKDFQKILEIRSDNVKKDKTRYNKFGKDVNIPTLIDSSVLHKNDIKYRSSSNNLNSHADAIININDLYDQNNRKSQNDTQAQQQAQLLIMEETVPAYMQERINAVETIESTIIELGEIYQQLAHLVHEQDEHIQRIDQNIEMTNLHIENAHNELLKYFASISSNRWLMIKIFAILFLFIIIFIFIS